jgi:integrase
MLQGRSAARARNVGRSLERFASAQGLGVVGPNGALVEAYCALGIPGRKPSTKGTYRSVLRQEARLDKAKGAPRYAGAPAASPYSGPERAELYSLACAQPGTWKRHDALVVLALGIGAGLRTGEIVAAARADVSRSQSRVRLEVGGPRSRTVVVEAPWDAVAFVEAERVGQGHLFHPGDADRGYHDFLNVVCRILVRDPGAPRLTVARCRSSYVFDRLSDGVALGAILAATGICEVESLLRYTRYLESAPQSKAALRRALLEGR